MTLWVTKKMMSHLLKFSLKVKHNLYCRKFFKILFLYIQLAVNLGSCMNHSVTVRALKGDWIKLSSLALKMLTFEWLLENNVQEMAPWDEGITEWGVGVWRDQNDASEALCVQLTYRQAQEGQVGVGVWVANVMRDWCWRDKGVSSHRVL